MMDTADNYRVSRSGIDRRSPPIERTSRTTTADRLTTISESYAPVANHRCRTILDCVTDAPDGTVSFDALVGECSHTNRKDDARVIRNHHEKRSNPRSTARRSPSDCTTETCRRSRMRVSSSTTAGARRYGTRRTGRWRNRSETLQETLNRERLWGERSRRLIVMKSLIRETAMVVNNE